MCRIVPMGGMRGLKGCRRNSGRRWRARVPRRGGSGERFASQAEKRMRLNPNKPPKGRNKRLTHRVPWVLLALLSVCQVAHAGFLGAIIGDAVIHHEEEKAREAGQTNRLTQHPVIGGIAGAVAGSSVEGVAVRNFAEHPIRDSVIGVGAVTMGGAYLVHKYHCHIVDPAQLGVPALWTCEDVYGKHPFAIEVKDLYIQRSSTAKPDYDETTTAN